MLRKLTAPYKYAPARISMTRIDNAITQGAAAELQGSGRRGLKSVDLVTFTVDGVIIDQFPVSGHVASTARFVASFNRTVAEQRVHASR